MNTGSWSARSWCARASAHPARRRIPRPDLAQRAEGRGHAPRVCLCTLGRRGRQHRRPPCSALPRAAQAYQDRRLAEHPCAEAIAYLQEQAAWPRRPTIVTQQIEVLARSLPLAAHATTTSACWTATAQTSRRKPSSSNGWTRCWPNATNASGGSNAATRPPRSQARSQRATDVLRHVTDVHILEDMDFGPCTLYRVAPHCRLGAARHGGSATAAPSACSHVETVPRKWAADCPWCYTGRVTRRSTASYTVFTQLLNAGGRAGRPAGQPAGAGSCAHRHLAARRRDPRSIWAGALVTLSRAGRAIGCWIGLYDDAGQPCSLDPATDGTVADHLAFPVDSTTTEHDRAAAAPISARHANPCILQLSHPTIDDHRPQHRVPCLLRCCWSAI